MRAELEAARAGRGSVLLISGEAGIGKTRLLDELSRLAVDPGRVHTAVARCASSEGPSLGPILQWLEALEGQRPPVDSALRRWASTGLSSPSVEPPIDRERVFERVAAELVAVARREPLLLVVDDLHLADADSLRFLELLAPRLRTARVVLACACRPTAEQRGIRRCLGALAREPVTRTFALEPFSRSEVEEYLAVALGASPPASVCDRLFQKTGGNPLLLGQVVQALRTQGRAGDAKVSTKGLVGGDAVREAIVHHIAALPESVSRLLTVACVFGSEFALVPLARTLATSTAEALEALDRAEAARIVWRSGSGTYRFTYPLVRDTLYLRLSSSERAQLHAGAATALEAQPESDDQLAADIASHLIEAAPLIDAERLARWSLRAAERAERVEAGPPAVLERALDAIALAHGSVVESRAKLLAFRQRV
jgi:predicted ATPase